MDRIVCIPLHGVGDDSFGIYPDQFMIDGVFPFDVRVYASGHFLRCAYSSSSLIHLDNPVSDSTFEFEIEYKLTELSDWTYSSGWYMVGTLYLSLGHVKISKGAIKTAIGETSNKFSEITTSALINIYSKYVSDKTLPHRQSEFVLYTHTMPGGVSFDYEVMVETTIGGAYVITASAIPWLYSYKILGFLGTIYKEIAGSPYTYTKIESAGTLSAAQGLLSGCRGMLQESGVLTNNDAGGSTATYYVKSYHCATIGGTYVEGQSLTVNITHSAKPYTVTSIVPTRVILDTVQIDFNTTGLTGYDIKFEARDIDSVDHSITATVVGDGAMYLELTTGTTFAVSASFPYRLSVLYMGVTWVIESSRSW